MTPVLCDARGPIVVGERIGGGGEGEIFRVGKRPGVALKLYHKPTSAHEAKVTAMIDARLHVASRSITFPVSIVRDARKRFVGFTMAEVREHAPIHELYATTSRRTAFPDADYRFLVRAAANVARAVAQVHAVGAVVGDINHSGFLVSPSATVMAIDADSFAIGKLHRCTVGVPDFTPPELQGQDLSTVGRTAQHDAFGLAVLIFQLLFLGRHPFAGRPSGRDVDIPGAVAQGRFAYSRIRDTRLAPPPGALSFARLPIAMRVAFERAFAIGLGHRPTAEHWLTLLDAFEQNLVRCATNGRHQFAPALDDCPFCEMDARSKLPIFGLVKPTALTGSAGALIKRGRGLLRDAHNLLDADLPIGTPSPGPSRKAIKQKQDPYFHTPED